MRILVVEDEKTLNRLISSKLKNEGFLVDSCFDGKAALSYFEGASYDAVILDIMLPEMNGLEVLQWIRQQNNLTPVLLLTARDSIDDRVNGLNHGADDYLIKPFVFAELVARIRALIRRNNNQTNNVVIVANLKVDSEKRTVHRDKQLILLSSKEFAILEYLIINEGIVLSRDTINQHVWNYDYEGASNIVDVYIRYLRKKIDDNFTPKLIHTIRGVGYVLRVEE